MRSLAAERLSYQQELRKRGQKPRIVVGLGTCGIAAGGGRVWEAVQDELASQHLEAETMSTGCIGMCYAEPILEVHLPGKPRVVYGNVTPEVASQIVREHVGNGTVVMDSVLAQEAGDNAPYPGIPELAHIPFYEKQVKTVLGNCGIIDPERIEEYIAHNGYKALEMVLSTMTPEQVIAEVKLSGLRGRGGGGFPTGQKWELVHKSVGDKKYVICNADEGDPGAFMDRSVLEGDPHAVLEGMAICAYAVGADEGIIYVRAEYPLAVKRLKKAIADAETHGVLGHDILGSGFNFRIRIAQGAGAFVCGEETALMASVEGKRGMPTVKPPYPAQAGLWGKPTDINNVETFANIPAIIRQGAEWFASMGTESSKGSKVFAITGKVNRTGLAEVPIGISLREIVYDIAGGIQNDKQFKAVQIGGPSGGCIPSQHLDTAIDYNSLLELGAMMGSGGLVVMDETTCMVDVARYFLHFTQEESCGKCTPCREGTKQMLTILERICAGNGVPQDLTNLERLAQVIKNTALCGLGQSAPNPVLATLRYFRDEYEAHIFEKRCPAGVCSALLSYQVVAEKCRGCTLCKKACPVGAISGEVKQVHVIDQAKCIRCGSCVEKCKLGAIIKR